jgi:putative hydrolase of the HAD superfamily
VIRGESSPAFTAVGGILFDMGGTLDGAGHWLERFVGLYKKCVPDLPREMIRQAFDEAERRAATDQKIATSSLKEMVQLHVGWQLQHLGIEQGKIEKYLVENFVAGVLAETPTNKQVLAHLAKLHFQLGIVSNGCGNTAILAKEFGYAPYLSAIVDSRCMGSSKPDPAIFLHALRELDRDPETVLMVGDSFERDISPAKSIGMRTAWLAAPETACPEPSLVDLRLHRLADLLALLSVTSATRA